MSDSVNYTQLYPAVVVVTADSVKEGAMKDNCYQLLSV